MPSIIKAVMSQYGPYAFGVASLLAVWFAIVGPELRAARPQYDRLVEIAETNRATAEALRTAAETIRTATESQRMMLDRLDRSIDRIDRRGS